MAATRLAARTVVGGTSRCGAQRTEDRGRRTKARCTQRPVRTGTEDWRGDKGVLATKVAWGRKTETWAGSAPIYAIRRHARGPIPRCFSTLMLRAIPKVFLHAHCASPHPAIPHPVLLPLHSLPVAASGEVSPTPPAAVTDRSHPCPGHSRAGPWARGPASIHAERGRVISCDRAVTGWVPPIKIYMGLTHYGSRISVSSLPSINPNAQ